MENYKRLNSFLLILFFGCAPSIYRETPGFIGVKNIENSKVEYFPQHTKNMGFPENFVPDLEEISKFESLESLEISSPQFKDFSRLAKFKKLQYLNLNKPFKIL